MPVIDTIEKVVGIRSHFTALLLLLFTCLSPMAAIVMAPNLPNIQQHFSTIAHIEYLTPIALTIPGLIMGFFSPVVGFLTDRFGRKKLLILSTFAYGILGSSPMFLDSFYLILASRVLLGFFEAVVITVSTTLIGDYYSAQLRKKYLALQVTAASTSAIFFFALGGYLGGISWRLAFVVYLVPIIFAILGQIFLWEPKRKTHNNLDFSKELRSTNEVTLFRPWFMLGIWVTAFLAAVTFMILQIQIPYLLATIGENSPKTAGNIAAISTVFIVIGTLVVQYFYKRGWSIAFNLLLGFGLIGISFILLSHATTSQQILTYALINGFGSGILLPTVTVWNMQNLPAEKRGLGIGMWQGFYNFGMFISPVIIVFINTFTGSLPNTLNLIGPILVVLAIFCVVYDKFRSKAFDPSTNRKAA
ncbi:MFS transporter [Acinetobacter baylyi]|uniref:MFS transporter n=1 Tax=Acinetobacter baylyi TaxID=202950 RepID=UPI000EA16B7B|nr:MFS transporter [Acinetobacter baylyi]